VHVPSVHETLSTKLVSTKLAIGTDGEITNQVTLDVGVGQMKQAFRAILQELKEEGFDTVRVEPQLRMNGANPGGFTKEFTIKIR
jgi:hypothetical protein